jgi:two-component system, NarL family, nitrate/nitrite response regulator NarL
VSDASDVARITASIALIMDGSMAMLGASTVLRETAGLGQVETFVDVGEVLRRYGPDSGSRLDAVVANPYDLSGGPPFDRMSGLFRGQRVLAFCPPIECADVVTLIQAGVRGYTGWDSPSTSFTEAVRTVCTDGFYLPGSMAAALFPGDRSAAVPGAQYLSDGAEPNSPPIQQRQLLAPRERQVLTSLAEGLTHKEIARGLGLSKTTVDTYVQRIRQKLGVGNKAELARVAFQFGLCADR